MAKLKKKNGVLILGQRTTNCISSTNSSIQVSVDCIDPQRSVKGDLPYLGPFTQISSMDNLTNVSRYNALPTIQVYFNLAKLLRRHSKILFHKLAVRRTFNTSYFYIPDKCLRLFGTVSGENLNILRFEELCSDSLIGS